jgi:hypothetical protein
MVFDFEVGWERLCVASFNIPTLQFLLLFSHWNCFGFAAVLVHQTSASKF